MFILLLLQLRKCVGRLLLLLALWGGRRNRGKEGDAGRFIEEQFLGSGS